MDCDDRPRDAEGCVTPSPDTVAINPDLAARGERIAAGIAEGHVRCPRCDEIVEAGADLDGCRDWACPMQERNQ